MLWMCIWMCPHHLMGAHADQACGLVFILAGAVCVIWEFAPVQTYAIVGLYLFSMVTKAGWRANRLATTFYATISYFIVLYVTKHTNKKNSLQYYTVAFST